MVDVSHLSDKAFADVCKMAKRPFIASHSNCRAFCPTLRNLTDDMIRELADHGGVMGINLASGFLDPEIYQQEMAYQKEFRSEGETPEATKRMREQIAAIPRPSIDWVAKHIRHAIDIGGEDCIGLGGDLDGDVTLPLEINGIADYVKISDLLCRAGFPARQVEKVCYQNLERVFTEVLW